MYSLKKAILFALLFLLITPFVEAEPMHDHHPPLGAEPDRAMNHKDHCIRHHSGKVEKLKDLEAMLNLQQDQKDSFNQWKKIELDYALEEKNICMTMPDKIEESQFILDHMAWEEKKLTLDLHHLQSAKEPLSIVYTHLTAQQLTIFLHYMKHHDHHCPSYEREDHHRHDERGNSR
jgi:hypothetical protein